MALLKARPTLHFYAPTILYPGQTFEGTVVARASRAMKVDSLDVRLLGKEQVTQGSGNAQRTHKTTLFSLGARLSHKATLAGEHRFACRFTLPHDCPPSYGGLRARTEYVVSIHVDIPWWPDTHASYEVFVALAPRDVPVTPAVVSSRPSGPVADEAHAEVALADTNLVNGGTLRGAVALSNVAFNRYGGATIALVGQERRIVGRRVEESNSKVYELNLRASDVKEGEAIPFAMRLPELQCSARSRTWEHRWWVELKLRRLLGSHLLVRTPVVVLPKDSKRPLAAGAERIAQYIGSPRLAAIWRAVGEHEGLHFDGSGLSGSHDAVQIRVEREHRGSAGVHLSGRLTFPSLYLGLDGGKLGSFERYLPGQRRVTWPNADHYFTGRELSQVETFARSAIPKDFGYAIADVNDESLSVECKDAGFDQAALAHFVYVVRALARQVPHAARAVPPPAASAGAMLKAFQDLAQRLGGELRPADLGVEGHWEDRRATVRTVWSADAKPVHVSVALRPTLPPPESLYGVYSPQQLPANLRPELRSAFAAVLQLGGELIVEAERFCALIPAPLTDVTVALDALSALASLELAMHRRGAYR